jgi:hypothetical protein
MNAEQPELACGTSTRSIETGGAECVETEASTHLDLALFLDLNTLPRSITAVERGRLERMGILFGKNVDDLFVAVTLPAGWGKALEEPPRAAFLQGCFLVDEKARRRAELTYENSSRAGRRASMRLLTRYAVDYVYFDDRGSRVAKFTSNRHSLAVLDAETIVHSTPIRPLKEQTRLGYKDAEKLHAWIAERFPRWQDPTAYWD